MSLSSKTVVVTGASGFIGSHLCKSFLDDGAKVIGIDNLATGRISNIESFKGNSNFTFLQKDAAHESCKEVIQDCDYIFHQGAIPSVPRSFEDPMGTHYANTEVTLQMLVWLKDSKKIKKFVFASSSSVYGNTPTLPKIETMPVDPLSPYAGQKFLSERYCQIFARNFNIPTVSLRYFNVFGPRQDPKSMYAAVIPRFMKGIRDGETITVFGDGKQTRDFTFVYNTIEANRRAALSGKPGEVYNIATGKNITLLRLIELIEKISGKKAKLAFQPDRVGDVKDSLADLQKFSRDTGYETKWSIETGLEETWRALEA